MSRSFIDPVTNLPCPYASRAEPEMRALLAYFARFEHVGHDVAAEEACRVSHDFVGARCKRCGKPVTAEDIREGRRRSHRRG
jgi:hypothetical protein